jgi:hypothetical protein
MARPQAGPAKSVLPPRRQRLARAEPTAFAGLQEAHARISRISLFLEPSSFSSDVKTFDRLNRTYV